MFEDHYFQIKSQLIFEAKKNENIKLLKQLSILKAKFILKFQGFRPKLKRVQNFLSVTFCL